MDGRTQMETGPWLREQMFGLTIRFDGPIRTAMDILTNLEILLVITALVFTEKVK